MADTFKFPNDGYDVTVCKKQDILDCIDENILDKEIALAIVEQCEKDAVDFIKAGRWTGLPFIGNIRIPRTTQLANDPIQKSLIAEAKETLDNSQYIIFRKQLNVENAIQAKNERYFNYIVSKAVNKNKKLYKKLCSEKGETYANIFLFASRHITVISNNYTKFEDNE